MTNKRKVFGMLGLVLALGLVFSSCATNVATSKATNFEKNPLSVRANPKYTILGPVAMDKDWFGVLGLTTPRINLPAIGGVGGNDRYIYQSGGITYVEILEAAKQQFPNADAVIDIKIDHSGSRYFVFYGKRKNIVSGIAIRYTRSEVDN